MNITEARQHIILSFLEAKLIGEDERDRFMADQNADVDLALLPFDSLKIMDLCMALEKRISREVEVDELVENDSLGRLARHLAGAA